MVYKLRERKENLVYPSFCSSSESEYETGADISDDPEYTRKPSSARRYPTDVQQMAEMARLAASSTGNLQLRRLKQSRPRKSSMPRTKARAQSSNRDRAGSSRHRRDNFEDKRTILSWLIDLHMIADNSPVFYTGQTELIGFITRAGILCTCCYKIVTVWDFEVHAKSDLRRPYEHMLVKSNGKSLQQCLKEAWLEHIESAPQFGFNHIKHRTKAADQNDDSCMICADGGDLMCCEKCPSACHPSCMNMESVPEGAWFCPYCICEHCETDDGKFLICSLCEKKFHWNCSLPNEIDLNRSSSSFCGESCSEIFHKLELIAGIKNHLDEGYSWTLLKREDISLGGPTESLHKKLECNSKIAVAGILMDQCFETIIDRYTRTNVVQSVIYSRGSNLSRINFQGFYTAILEKDDEIVSAASIRIHGKKMAEMPFVATQTKYRQQGALRKLLVCIESALSSLKVENLVIPASTEIVDMWTKKFNFCHVESSLQKKIVSENTLMFPKAVRLQKSLLDAQEADTAAMEVDVVQNEHHQHRYERPPFIDLNQDPSEEDIDAS
ncbi:hypothetical protein ACFX13_038458 [Malus domestica]|uniref:increased DNA methylation 1-like n=1 Tax=Malus domestica TaxID=3750 RepID=UPI000498944C|nr:increased DNA methylation 1-like [Malus domestica]